MVQEARSSGRPRSRSGGCVTWRNPADPSAGAVERIPVHGFSRSILHLRGCFRDRARPQCCSRIHLGQSGGACVEGGRIRDRCEGREWLCMPGRAIMGEDDGRSGVLESASQSPTVREWASRKELPAHCADEDQTGFGVNVTARNSTGAQIGDREQSVADVGAECNVLHDVKAAVSERP